MQRANDSIVSTGNAVDNPTRALFSFFLLTIAFTWTFWFLAILESNGRIDTGVPAFAWVVLGGHGPLVAPLVLSWRSGGWTAVKRLLAAGFDVRMRPVWWGVIFVLPLTIAGIAFWLTRSFHDLEIDTPLLEQPWMIIGVLLFMHFLGGSVQEEFGWRGFALPRLLEMYTPFTSSLVLGAIWGIWHLPLFYVSGVGQEYWSFAIFLPLTFAFSMIFTWIYLRTDRNLFSALLLHTVINTSLNVFPPVEQIDGASPAGTIYLLAFYALAAVLIVIKERALFFGASWARFQQSDVQNA